MLRAIDQKFSCTLSSPILHGDNVTTLTSLSVALRVSAAEARENRESARAGLLEQREWPVSVLTKPDQTNGAMASDCLVKCV